MAIIGRNFEETIEILPPELHDALRVMLLNAKSGNKIRMIKSVRAILKSVGYQAHLKDCKDYVEKYYYNG